MLLVLIVLGVSAYFTLRTSKAQTYITQKFASHYSNKLGTRVEIKGVDISFFNSIILEGVYVEDRHQDTLLDAEKITVAILDFDLKNQKIYVSDINLINSKTKIIKYPNEKGLNYKFLIDALSSKDTSNNDSSSWKVGLGGITLTNLDFAYRDKRNNDSSRGMDFEDIRVKSLNAKFTDFQFFDDSLKTRIKYLSATEKSGFILTDLSSNVTVRDSSISMDDLKIRTPFTYIDTDAKFLFNEIDDLSSFVEKVTMKYRFRNSNVSMYDISFFAPELKGMDEMVRIRGKISGKVGNLKSKNLEIGFARKTYLRGDLDMTGLPDIDNTFIVFNVKEFLTDHKDLSQIPVPPFTSKEKLEIPGNIPLLGDIRFKGQFSGLLTNFVAYGNFKTALGEINSDVSIEESETGQITYSGNVETKSFAIGPFLEIKDVGKVALDVEVQGSGLNKETMNASLKKGIISSLEYKGYAYKNLEVRGEMSRKIFRGELIVEDENLGLVFSGDVDFNKKIPALDFTAQIEKADLAKVHLIKGDKFTDLSASIIMKLNGDNVDNLHGTVTIENTKFKIDTSVFTLRNLELTADPPGKERRFRLNSDFADATVEGNFQVSNLNPAIKKVLSQYIPSLFKENNNQKARYKSYEDNIDFVVNVKNASDITRLFLPELQVSPQTRIAGEFNAGSGSLTAEIKSDRIEYEGVSFKNVQINGGPDDAGEFSFRSNIDRVNFQDSVWVDKFEFVSLFKEDSAKFSLSWKNSTKTNYSGTLDGTTVFYSPSKIKTRLNKSEIILHDSTWVFNGFNEITYDSGRVHINDLVLYGNSQAISLNGTLSSRPSDALFVNLSNFNLETLNKYLKKQDLQLKGIVNSRTTVSNLFGDIVFTSNSSFSKLNINNEMLGDGDVEALYDRRKEAIYLQGNFSKGLKDPETDLPIKNLVFDGFYYPKKKEQSLDMELRIYAMQLSILQPYVKEYCTIRGGQFGGTLDIQGTPANPKITGSIDLTAKALTVNYLNTTYWVANQNIRLEENSFVLENFKITDQYNDTLTINNGHVFHENYKNFQLDFDMSARKFMVLNTSEADNSLYYGTTFVTGIISVFGFVDQTVTIDANVKTDRTVDRSKNKIINSTFNIPLATVQEVGSSDFIKFIVKDTSQKKKPDYQVRLDGITLNFDVEITPDVELQLVFDSKVGDVIRARGNGDLKMKINTLGAFNMYGDFTVESGDYLFTLGNIINKRFRLEKGGNLKWDGDPYQATMDMSAIYQVRTSLKPFFPSDSSGAFKKRYPVDCILNLNGLLMNPGISFEINLPTVDESTRQEVKDMINSEQETNKQVFSLLVLNSFVTPPIYRDLAVDNSGSNAGAATGSELLSHQLSNWLSQISNDFDIGVKYRPGGQLTSDEVEVALSTQFFNDRVSVDANVGVGSAAGSSQSANNIVGDMNVEYKLTDNGKVRIKAFNKSNDNVLNNLNAPYTQGVGIFYREEFNTIDELYERYKAKLDRLFNRKKPITAKQ